MRRKEASFNEQSIENIDWLPVAAFRRKHAVWREYWGVWWFPPVTVAADVHPCYGAIVGDICGSVYKLNNRKIDNPAEIVIVNQDCLFTDATVLTVATADEIQSRVGDVTSYYDWAMRYPTPHHSEHFTQWLEMGRQCRVKNRPIRTNEAFLLSSEDSGAAMRVSPIGWLLEVETDVKQRRENLAATASEAASSAGGTHSCFHGKASASIVASLIYLARCGSSKEELREWLQGQGEMRDEYQEPRPFEDRTIKILDKTLAGIRPDYQFDESAIGTVPVAIAAFFESHDFISAIQNAISVGGDSPVIAAITGSIAEAFYGEVPQELIAFAKSRLPQELIAVIEGTDAKYADLYCPD
jgi:ADP-ribosylglycohydrolase